MSDPIHTQAVAQCIHKKQTTQKHLLAIEQTTSKHLTKPVPDKARNDKTSNQERQHVAPPEKSSVCEAAQQTQLPGLWEWSACHHRLSRRLVLSMLIEVPTLVTFEGTYPPTQRDGNEKLHDEGTRNNHL